MSQLRAQVYLPHNLNLPKLMEKNPPVNGLHLDNLKYLLHLINLVAANFPDSVTSDGFVGIKASRMKKFVGQYLNHIEYLCRLGVIESDNHYIVGSKAIGYRYTVQYQTTLVLDFITKPALLKKIVAEQSEKIKTCDKYPYLKKWFNDKLKLDSAAAREFLLCEFRTNLNRMPKHIATQKFEASFVQATQFNAGWGTYHVDNTINRLHTKITRLRSKLRNFLTYDGKGMACIDIGTASHYFGLLLFNPDFYKPALPDSANGEIQRLCMERIYPEMYYDLIDLGKKEKRTKKQIEEMEVLPSHLKLLPSYMIPLLLSPPTDLVEYRNLILNRRLYDRFGEIVEYYKDEGFHSKKELKAAYSLAAFSKNRFYHQPEALNKRAFFESFPTIDALFQILKKSKHFHLPNLLVRIEAHLMLDIITKRISEEKPDMPIYTVHDCLVMPETEIDYAANVMFDELYKAVGEMPSLQVEIWSPDNRKVE